MSSVVVYYMDREARSMQKRVFFPRSTYKDYIDFLGACFCDAGGKKWDRMIINGIQGDPKVDLKSVPVQYHQHCIRVLTSVYGTQHQLKFKTKEDKELFDTYRTLACL